MAKFYAVKKGRSTGIFRTWSECEQQVKSFAGAEYKSFKTEEEALRYLGQEEENYLEPQPTPDYYAYVDGSYDNNSKIYGSGVVFVENGKKVEHYFAGNKEEMIDLRNVAGEIEAAKWAIYYAIRKELPEITIYHDYLGIALWAEKKWTANLEYTKDYVRYIEKARKLIKINFIKVEAHTGVELNEEVDRLAKKAIEEFKKRNKDVF